MKKLVLSLVLLCGCVSFEPVIESRHDVYSGVSSQQFAAKFSPDGLNLYTVKLIKAKSDMVSHMILLNADMNGWKFIDSVRVVAGESRIASKSVVAPIRRVYRARVREIVTFPLTKAEFDSIVGAQSVMMRFAGTRGLVECVFNADEIRKLSEYKILVSAKK